MVDFSTVSLLIQWVGILVILGLLLFLTQSIRRPSLDYWAAAWCCLALALAALYVDVEFQPQSHLLRVPYFLGEYGFGFLLVAGCRNFASGPVLTWRSLRWVPAGLAAALLLIWLTPDLNVEFAIHAPIVAALCVAAFAALRPARRLQRGPGFTVMSAGLLLLAIDLAHNTPVFLLATYLGRTRRFAYLNYTSVVDLIFETVLGFGMVMLTMESLRQQSEQANRELQDALGRLEVLARTDPLTSALNRHAYHSLLGSHDPADLAGSVAVVDVNELKQINDRDGHLAGDVAIRQVATAIRSVIRADDLLFRWGGDEFLVVLRSLDPEETRRRFESVNAILADSRQRPAAAEQLPLSVSFGIAPFGAGATIEQAAEKADSLMYLRKRGSGER
ncbi:MAG TPA: GGDEF domain-containing protein [Thermoanaerobaculia bacterium]|nr:GGDEF domain-containing protein [Thermoanaerobaculia bacterium]